MEQDIPLILHKLEEIKARNKRVEAAKAWETSFTRRILVAFLTYAIVVIFMTMADFTKPFLEALIPTAAYLISVSSVTFAKKWWIKKYTKG